jgi:hypothetical protein
MRSPGQPLEPEIRRSMEVRFGHSFAAVRVHSDDLAARSARAVNALAYTVDSDIVFDRGRYAPTTAEGWRLLAHELAHVTQQQSAAGSEGDPVRITPSDGPLERDAARLVAGAFGTVNQAAPALTSAGDRVLTRQEAEPGNALGCNPAAGKPPSASNCAAYRLNSSWLPDAYVVNGTCACLATPNSPTANCVRQFLQDRLAATPTWLKTVAAARKAATLWSSGGLALIGAVAEFAGGAMLSGALEYELLVQTVLTPRIYADHVEAYRTCCCPSGPAPYPAWIGVTTVPIPDCDLVGLTIRWFGSCHGTPGAW